MNFADFIIGGRYGIPFILQVLLFIGALFISFFRVKVLSKRVIIMLVMVSVSTSILLSLVILSVNLMVEDVSVLGAGEILEGGREILFAYLLSQWLLILGELVFMGYMVLSNKDVRSETT